MRTCNQFNGTLPPSHEVPDLPDINHLSDVQRRVFYWLHQQREFVRELAQIKSVSEGYQELMNLLDVAQIFLIDCTSSEATLDYRQADQYVWEEIMLNRIKKMLDKWRQEFTDKMETFLFRNHNFIDDLWEDVLAKKEGAEDQWLQELRQREFYPYGMRKLSVQDHKQMNAMIKLISLSAQSRLDLALTRHDSPEQQAERSAYVTTRASQMSREAIYHLFGIPVPVTLSFCAKRAASTVVEAIDPRIAIVDSARYAVETARRISPSLAARREALDVAKKHSQIVKEHESEHGTQFYLEFSAVA